MPWKVINQMDLKIQLINDRNHGYSSITDLSQKYGVSRPTIYKWLKRYEQFGIEGLKELADGLCQIQFSFYVLGSIDLRKNKIIRN